MSLIDGRRIIFVNTILNRATPVQIDSFSLNLARRTSSAPITELLTGYIRFVLPASLSIPIIGRHVRQLQ